MFWRKKDKDELIETLPLVPLRDVVFFPHMTIPFLIGRPGSIKALEHALKKGKRIFLSVQHDAARNNPGPDEIYTVGTICNIIQSLKLVDGNYKVMMKGLDRGRALEFKEDEGFLRVVVKLIPRHVEGSTGVEPMMSAVIALLARYAELSRVLHFDVVVAAVRVEDPGELADTIASHLTLAVAEKQDLLETLSPLERLKRLRTILEAKVAEI